MMKKKNLLAQAITLSLLLSVPVGSAWAKDYTPVSVAENSDGNVDLEYSLYTGNYNPIKTTAMMGISSTPDSYDKYNNKMVNDLTITAGDTIGYSAIIPGSDNKFLSNIKGNFSVESNSNQNAVHLWSENARADLSISANNIYINSNKISLNAVNGAGGDNVVTAVLNAKNDIVINSTNIVSDSSSAVFVSQNKSATKGAEIVLTAGNDIRISSDSKNAVSIGQVSSAGITAGRNITLSGEITAISNALKGELSIVSSEGDVIIEAKSSDAVKNSGNIEISATGTEISSNNSMGIVNASGAQLTIENTDLFSITGGASNHGIINIESGSMDISANRDMESTSLWTDAKDGQSDLKAKQGDIVITTKKDDGSYYTGRGIMTSCNTDIEAAGKVVVDVYERGIASNGGNLSIQAQELKVTAGTHAINAYSSGTVTVDAPIVNLTAANGIDKTYGDYELAVNVSTGSKVDFLNAKTISIDGGISAKGANDDGQVSEVNIEAKDAITIKGTIKNVGETANTDVIAGGIININQAANSKAVVNIESDIYRGLYPYANGGEATSKNGSININLNNEQSSLNGNIYDANDYESDSDGVHLGLAGGAAWNTDGSSTVKEIASDGGKINFTGSSEQKVYFDTLSGNDTTITLNHIGAEKLTVANDKAVNTHLIADKSASEEANGDLEAVVQSTNMKSVTDVAAQESSVYGAMSAKVENNHVVRSTVVEKTNIANQGISEMASISLMAWRQENNDMNKRLGELRDSSGEHGVWVRMTRGEAKYGAQNVKNQYNSYQLGYDEKLSVDKSWTVGAALTYTDAESRFAKGKGENKHKGFAVYGSKLNKDGSFIDLIAKYSRLEHEFEVAGGAGKGDYNIDGYSVSAEYGKRFTKDNGLWIEPQAELTYGRVGSADYVTNQGVRVRQEGMDSVVARLGFAAGKSFKQGNAYVRASYLYDFAGETDVTFNKSGAQRGFEQDLGSGWWEVGIGTNLNFSKAAHFYLDVEKTYGGNVATPWQWNAGLRWSF